MKISDDLLQKVKAKYRTFRLTHLYEYKFPANLANIEMNLDDFFVLQRGSYEWDYFVQHFELKCPDKNTKFY